MHYTESPFGAFVFASLKDVLKWVWNSEHMLRSAAGTKSSHYEAR